MSTKTITKSSSSSKTNTIPKKPSTKNKSKTPVTNTQPTTLTSTLPPILPVIKRRGVESGGGGVGESVTKNTSNTKPQSLESSLDPRTPSTPHTRVRTEDCTVLQREIREKTGIGRGRCNCYACGGDVRHHDVGLEPLPTVHDDYDSDKDEVRGAKAKKKRPKKRDRSPSDDDKKVKQNSRKRSHHTTFSNRSNKNDSQKSSSKVGSKAEIEKSSKRRSHRKDEGDGVKKTHHRNSRKSSGVKNTDDSTKAVADPPVNLADEPYKRVKSLIDKTKWNDKETIMQERALRVAKRASINQSKFSQKVSDKKDTVESLNAGKSPVQGPSTDVDQGQVLGEKNKNDNIPPHVASGSGKVYTHLFLNDHFPLHYIQLNSKTYTTEFAARIDSVRNVIEKQYPPKETMLQIIQDFKPDIQSFMEMPSDTTDEDLMKKMTERVNKCIHTVEYFEAQYHNNGIDALTLHCEACGIIVNRHKHSTVCTLSQEEVRLQVDNDNRNKNHCGVCFCLIDKHVVHDNIGQERRQVMYNAARELGKLEGSLIDAPAIIQVTTLLSPSSKPDDQNNNNTNNTNNTNNNDELYNGNDSEHERDVINEQKKIEDEIAAKKADDDAFEAGENSFDEEPPKVEGPSPSPRRSSGKNQDVKSRSSKGGDDDDNKNSNNNKHHRSSSKSKSNKKSSKSSKHHKRRRGDEDDEEDEDYQDDKGDRDGRDHDNDGSSSDSSDSGSDDEEEESEDTSSTGTSSSGTDTDTDSLSLTKPRPCSRYIEEFEEAQRKSGFTCRECKGLVLLHEHKPLCMLAKQDFPISSEDIHCYKCHVLVSKHDIRPEYTGHFKFIASSFPTFNEDDDDPHIFMKKFEDSILLSGAPPKMWNVILKTQVTDLTLQKWVDENSRLIWAGPGGMRELFIRRTKRPDYEVKLREKLAKLRNRSLSDLHAYFRDFIECCYLLNYDMSSNKVIEDCEAGLCTQVQKAIQNHRNIDMYHTKTNSCRGFNSVYDLQTVAMNVLAQPRLGERDYNRQKPRKRYDNSKNNTKTKFNNKRRWNNKNKNKNQNNDDNIPKTWQAKLEAQIAQLASKLDEKKDTNIDGKPHAKKKQKTGSNKGKANDAPKKCYICKQEGHLMANCKYNKFPQASYLASTNINSNLNSEIDRNLNLNLIRHKRKSMVVKIAAAKKVFGVLPDSGADISIIRADLVRDYKLHVFPPKGPKFIRLADKSKVKRKGFVLLAITVMFPDTDRQPVVLRQQFEVLNIEPNFIFGTDILPTLFHSDEFTQYMPLHSNISSEPTIMLCDDNIDEESSSNMTLAEMSIPRTFSLSEKDTDQEKSKKNTKRVKFDLDLMKSYDAVSKSIESALNEEFEEMQNQMKNFSVNNDMNIDDEISKNMQKKEENIETLNAMQLYFSSHNMPMTGPWRSTLNSRVQRHMQ